MSGGVFAAVLFAAFLHASWNAVIKVGSDKLRAMFVMSSAQGLMGLAIALTLPFPGREMWPWLVFSMVFHSAYKAFLTLAYERGDLSRVYPIARGTAPLLVAVIGFLILGERLQSRDVVAILLVGAGILLMGRGVFAHGESRALLPFALASASMTAGYSLVDGSGARVSGQPGQFVAWMFLLDGMLFATWAIWHRGHVVVSRDWPSWRAGIVAGAASYGAYAIIVWAMARAPIALVAALRESSVLFAVLLGLVLLRERPDRGKLLAAVLIVAGVVVIRI